MSGEAVISECGRYRYALWHDLPVQGTLNDGSPESAWFTADETCLFVMLNPSTADATADDPTIRRCISFARSWGFGRLAVANLYALRSTDPAALWEADDPVGPDNDQWIIDLANESSMSVCAWGAEPRASDRAKEVTFVLAHGTPCMALGLTAEGAPRHPLYVPASVEPIEFPTIEQQLAEVGVDPEDLPNDADGEA